MTRFILASGSVIRAEMLRNAGVVVETQVARVDEAMVKRAMLEDGASARDLADVLAEMKARRVAARNGDALVLGADQVLVCDGKVYDKPETVADARAQLAALRGKTHELLSAAVIFENGAPVWRFVGKVRLTMRDFTDAFLDTYVAGTGEELLTTVGGYKLESTGAQVFSRVEGDYFSVLGLPLLEVLGFLRTRGVCLE